MVHNPTKTRNTLPTEPKQVSSGSMARRETDPFDQLFDQMFRRTVGFDYLPQLFDRSKQSFPHYDIRKQDDNTYVVQVALAGYNSDDISVSQTDWDLVISSQASDDQQQNDEQSGYLHKGIAKRSFTLRLGLGLHTEVTDAVMKDGMLYVTVTQHDQDSNRPIQVRKE